MQSNKLLLAERSCKMLFIDTLHASEKKKHNHTLAFQIGISYLKHAAIFKLRNPCDHLLFISHYMIIQVISSDIDLFLAEISIVLIHRFGNKGHLV